MIKHTPNIALPTPPTIAFDTAKPTMSDRIARTRLIVFQFINLAAGATRLGTSSLHRASQPVISLLGFRLRGSLFRQGCLRRGQTRDGHPIGRATDVAQADLVAELHAR